ncbi:MAG: hypothetical protein M3O61_02885 [Gemmatimonadota bacterium]|nr:hypothetical protein [Gemmatimonadota bacterium]
MSEASRPVGIIDDHYSLTDERNVMAVVTVASLTSRQRSEMLALLQTCYTNVSAAQFNRDLDEKEWVILANDLNGEGMRGFSTLRTIRVTVDDEPIVAFYSGDTVARPDTHGSATTFAGTRLVIRKMFYEMSRSQVPRERFVWFTINSTVKGYRLTSMIFREFVPTPGRPLSPADRRLIAELCRVKGLAFDSATGIVRLENPTMPRELLGQGEASRQDDPYVRFFRSANPGADAGERIASLIELARENLTPVGDRMVFR